ncbi:hypothetical protein ACHAQA_009153 [Verticillium albo-atrum]
MEAHLDNMLAEGEGGPAGAKPAQTSSTPQRQPTPVPSKNVPASPRTSSSSSRVNDRLQERLAKAVANRGGTATNEAASARTSTDEGLSNKAIESPTIETSTERPSEQSRNSERSNATITDAHPAQQAAADETQNLHVDNAQETETQESTTAEVGELQELAQGAEDAYSTRVASTLPESRCSRCDALDAKLLALQTEHRDELHRSVEQVDALQAKLQYLSREASQAARKAAAEGLPGTLERKLAEKDERIALLMEEGRGMAATEQKHRNVIKKLRAQVADNEKTSTELKATLQDTQTGLASLHASNSRLEELERTQSTWQTQTTQMRTEVDTLQSDLVEKEGIIKSLRQDLQKAMDEADTTASRRLAEALEAEKRRVRDFEDNIASLQVEKSLVIERAKKREAELSDKADQMAERSRVAQLELQGELHTTEGRLEAMRALAEEASSGAVGDSQAKLLRQMETLQTQHAIASENWQGIEASLVARLGNLEKERDDALRRESDMRKKARETALRCKRQEEEIQDLNGKVPTQQQESDTLHTRLDFLQKRAEVAEAALAHTKAEFEKQQIAWKAERGDTPDRRLWLEDVPVASPRMQSRPDSPLLSVPMRTFSSDLLVLQGPPKMVALMKETQSGKAASRKVSELEAEVADINARYQTTLELLGEKSELVEELKADVEDVKAMYRDLVERTVKG